MGLHFRLCYLIMAAALCAAACDDNPTAPSPTVRSVSVSGPDLYMGFVDSARFTASAVLADGTSKDVTSQATWQSSNNAIASVTSTGEVKAAAFGAATITARYQSVTCSQMVTVRCGVFLDIAPPGPLQISTGSSVRLRTFANFVTPMYEQVFGTLSSSHPEVATVAIVPQTTDWQLTAIAAGQTTIHATYQCGTEDLLVTVTAGQ
jgi:uncharacterized protein YjdB